MLATDSDVVAALGRPLEQGEQQRVQALIGEASDLVEGHTRRRFPVPAPGAVTRVVARMVARVLGVDTDVDPAVESEQLSAGPYQVSTRIGADMRSGGPWLSRADKTALAPYRRGVTNQVMW